MGQNSLEPTAFVILKTTLKGSFRNESSAQCVFRILQGDRQPRLLEDKRLAIRRHAVSSTLSTGMQSRILHITVYLGICSREMGPFVNGSQRNRVSQECFLLAVESKAVKTVLTCLDFSAGFSSPPPFTVGTQAWQDTNFRPFYQLHRAESQQDAKASIF